MNKVRDLQANYVKIICDQLIGTPHKFECNWQDLIYDGAVGRGCDGCAMCPRVRKDGSCIVHMYGWSRLA